jgi:type IV pilus assembly protein PilB
MGIQPFLLASTLNMAVAQRLLRKLCNHCKEQVIDETQPGIPRSLFKMPALYYKPVGCPECNFTGYSGRIAVFEIVEICEELRVVLQG